MVVHALGQHAWWVQISFFNSKRILSDRVHTTNMDQHTSPQLFRAWSAQTSKWRTRIQKQHCFLGLASK
jgi:hypothetical protein